MCAVCCVLCAVTVLRAVLNVCCALRAARCVGALRALCAALTRPPSHPQPRLISEEECLAQGYARRIEATMKHCLEKLDRQCQGRTGRLAVLRAASPLLSCAIRTHTPQRALGQLTGHEVDQLRARTVSRMAHALPVAREGAGHSRSHCPTRLTLAFTPPPTHTHRRFIGTTLLMQLFADSLPSDVRHELATRVAATAGIVPAGGRPLRVMPHKEWHQLCHNLALHTSLGPGRQDLAAASQHTEGPMYGDSQQMALCRGAVVSVEGLMVSCAALGAAQHDGHTASRVMVPC